MPVQTSFSAAGVVLKTSLRAPLGNKVCETSFEAGVHLAHAVSGGPYVVSDTGKKGWTNVALDGSGSHSHASDETSVGEIVSYEWSWFDKSLDKTASALGEQTIAPFPVGITTVTLTVQDQYGNCAAHQTEVTVRASTQPGAYCYFYNFGTRAPTTGVPLPALAKSKPAAQYGKFVPNINFEDSFGKFKFESASFAVRCVFTLSQAPGTHTVAHNGPLKVYVGEKLIAQKTGYAPASTIIPAQTSQILYFRKAGTPGLLKLTAGSGLPVPASKFSHDSSTILPIVDKISKTTSFAGQIISVHGFSFGSKPVVKFGNVIAPVIESGKGSVSVKVPPQRGPQKVQVVVITSAGSSNGRPFSYTATVKSCQVPKFTATSLLDSSGQPYAIKGIAVVRVGPDGRLYLGSQRNFIHALTINSNLQVMKKCSKKIGEGSTRRWVLGIAFNPKSTALNMYFSTCTMFGQAGATNWNNGKVQLVTLAGKDSCFGVVKDIIVGLPVSNHDHGVNFLQFLQSGSLLVSVASSTNGGISVPGDALGGLPDSSISGAILQCPSTGYHVIKYTNIDPSKAQVTSTCKVWASGFRNSVGAELHTNGHLYATDNGPNSGFGSLSMDCSGTEVSGKDTPDRLHLVQPGKCHGHPNLARGKAGDPKQCVFRSKQCVSALLDNLKPSTNGVLEYRSNLFDGALKGALFLSKFSNGEGKKGELKLVELSGTGQVKSVTSKFSDDSGISIVEGPRGQLIMSRVYKSSFYVLKPQCDTEPSGTYLIRVYPRRGPSSGGHRVLISGFGFGSTPSASFGSKPCVAPLSIDDGSFMCTTPKGSPNSQVKVTVVGALGKESSHTTGGDYWYW